MTLGTFGIASLLGMAAILVAAIVVLYLFRLPPKRAVVSSLKVWRAVAEELNIRRRRRWRWWASLALMCLMALLVLGALGDPSAGAGVTSIIVLDTSPTMSATVGAATVWDEAISIARGYILDHPRNLFWLADSRGHSFTAEYVDASTAVDLLIWLRPTWSGVPTLPDLPLSDETLFISDGISPPDLGNNIRWVSVFAAIPNLAITQVGAPFAPEGRARSLPVSIGNFSTGDESVEVRLIKDGQILVSSAIVLPAGDERVERIALPRDLTGVVTIEIEGEPESVLIDNKAFAYIPPESLRVAFVAPTSSDLHVALLTLPGITVRSYSPAEWTGRADEFDLVVFEDWAPREAIAKPTLYVGEFGPGWMGAEQVQTAGVDQPSWASRDPLFQGLSPNDLFVDQGPLLTFPDAEVLVGSPSEPLILEWPEVPRVLVNFALERSNWSLSPAFPVILERLLKRLVDTPEVIEQVPGTLTLPVTATGVRHEDQSVPFVVDERGVTFEAEAPGTYQLDRERGPRSLVLVNAVDRAYSDLRQPKLEAATQFASVGTGINVWKVLLLVAIGLFVLEWTLFHRGITV